MRKLVLIAPIDEVDSVINKLISLRCIGFSDFSEKEGQSLLCKCDFDTEIAAQEDQIKRIEKAISVLSKYSREKIRLGDVRKKSDRGAFVSSGECGLARDAVEKANNAIDALDSADACENAAEVKDASQRALAALTLDLQKIYLLYDIERTKLEILKIKAKASYSDTCAFVLGWMPKKAQESVENVLSELLCAYEITEPEEDDEPPVRISGNPITRCFEWITSGFGTPKYFFFDPTMIMSIFFFVAFGLMLHDVGYGLILMIVGFAGAPVVGLHSRARSVFGMLGICGVSSAIFGVLLGGWFGNMPYAIMQDLLGLEGANEALTLFDGFWFKAVRTPVFYLIICLAFGALQIITKMIISFILLCKEGKVAQAIFEILPWWIIFAGIATVFTVSLVFGLIVAGVGALVILVFHSRDKKSFWARLGYGFVGLGAIARYIAELANYLKIFAVGMSVGIVTYYVNLLGTLVGDTAFGYIFFAAVSVVGHTLIICLATFSAVVMARSIQKEFLSPFCARDGKEFIPAVPCEKYTIDMMEMEAV